MLDGEKLYKTGAQKKFLDKYFGDVDGVKEVKLEELSMGRGDKSDASINAKNAEGIPTPSYKFFEDKDVKTEGKLVGRMMKLKGVSEGKESTIYLFVQGIDGENLLVVWSRSFHTFKNYLRNSVGGSPEVEGGEEIDPTKKLYATKIEKTKIFPGRNLEIKSIKKDGKNIVKSDQTPKFEIQETSFLAKKDGEKSVEVFVFDFSRLTLCIDKEGGFKDIKTLLDKDYEGGFKPITTSS
jgi:hypothetical protein